jgi:serine/threonine-protein kinase
MPLSKVKEKILIQELIYNASLHLMLRQVKSPYIISYFGFELYDNKYVMIMEYADGGSLRNLMEDEFDSGPMPLDRSLRYIDHMCQGLAAIHSCSLIHRDIKPDNILLDNKNDSAKLSDFGIARMLLQGQESMTNIGTYLYMAPEVISGQAATFSSDIYSLGVTFYEMVSGVHPFIKESIGESIDFIRSGSPPDPSEINTEIRPRIGKVILQAISKNQNTRLTLERLAVKITG